MVEAPDGWNGGSFSCPQCSDGVDVRSSLGAVLPEAGGPGTKPCPLCSRPIKEEAVKCRHCGEFIDHPPGEGKSELYKLRAEYQKGMRIMAWIALLITLIWGSFGVFGVFKALDQVNPVPGLSVAALFLGLTLVLLVGTVMAFRHSPWGCIPLMAVGGLGTLGQGFKIVTTFIASGKGMIVDLPILLLFATLAVGSIVSLAKFQKIKAAGIDPRAKWER
jgi:hypothetical protein